MFVTVAKSIVCFNPRPYVRGDGRTQVGRTQVGSFNPRPYVRGDANGDRFQSAPLREGRWSIAKIQRPGVNGFNPRPYVRGDASPVGLA